MANTKLKASRGTTATGTPDATTFLRGDNSWASAGATAGQVIQVLSATDNTRRATTSSTFITGSNTLSVTITPSATANKILIIVNISAYATSSGSACCVGTIYRGSTNLGGGGLDGLGFVNGVDGATQSAGTLGMTYLDSPNTTSATTYQVYFKSKSLTTGTPYDVSLNVANNDSTTNKGSIVVMEIKG